MGQHAGLRRYLQPRDDVVEHVGDAADGGDVVGCRVDPDHRVTGAVKQAIDD